MGAAAAKLPKGTPQPAPAPAATEDPNQLAVTLRIGELCSLIREQVAMALDAHEVVEWVDQEKIAQHLDVSVGTVVQMCRDEGMPHSWAGQHRRFSRRIVDEWMAGRPPPERRGK